MTVYLLRHGDIYNPDKIVYGRLPGFHLNENGKDQIRRAAEKLKESGVVSIYSSPLERTIESSQIVATVLGVDKNKIFVENDLIESDCKEWEGKPFDSFLQETKYTDDPKNQTAVESLLDSGKRVLKVLEKALIENQDALVVSHGDPIMGAIMIIRNDWTLAKKHYIEKGGFVKLVYLDNKWQYCGNNEI